MSNTNWRYGPVGSSSTTEFGPIPSRWRLFYLSIFTVAKGGHRQLLDRRRCHVVQTATGRCTCRWNKRLRSSCYVRRERDKCWRRGRISYVCAPSLPSVLSQLLLRWAENILSYSSRPLRLILTARRLTHSLMGIMPLQQCRMLPLLYFPHPERHTHTCITYYSRKKRSHVLVRRFFSREGRIEGQRQGALIRHSKSELPLRNDSNGEQRLFKAGIVLAVGRFLLASC